VVSFAPSAVWPVPTLTVVMREVLVLRPAQPQYTPTSVGLNVAKVMMPSVVPAPVMPALYSGVMLFCLARSLTEYLPGLPATGAASGVAAATSTGVASAGVWIRCGW